MRTTALGLSSTSGRLGGMAAPMVMYLASGAAGAAAPPPSSRLPLAAYGACMASAAAAACLWLRPETAWAAALPDTMDVGEAAAAADADARTWCRRRGKGEQQEGQAVCIVSFRKVSL